MPAFVSSHELEVRLQQACQRLPGLRIVACENMGGECFAVDHDGPTIYYDGRAPTLQQRRFLMAALGVVTAVPEDQDRYRASAAASVGCGSLRRECATCHRAELRADTQAPVLRLLPDLRRLRAEIRRGLPPTTAATTA